MGRCEYCGLSQEGQEATFHIDHVIPLAAGGKTVAENLALACVSCSLRKAARQTAIDPQSGKEVALTIHGTIPGMSTFSGMVFIL
jgi:5-methylcytosine-specific restriction endonuclease McrA